MWYPIKMPRWFSFLYPHRLWYVKTNEKVLYLTFDDGPTPEVTPFVLNLLQQYNAKASFFCIGKNVVNHPHIYNQILQQGHVVGNHTHNHLNGWKTNTNAYIKNVEAAAAHIQSSFFRPPYGKIRTTQAKYLKKYILVMWSILSGDFDKISVEKCINNVLKNVRNGSVIVFHDSEKAYYLLKNSLPVILSELNKQGYVFKSLEVA